MKDEGFLLIPYEDIGPDPNQPRIEFFNVDELATSIRENGLLQNIVVARNRSGKGTPYIISAGERRWRAIGRLIEQGKWLGMVPCLVLDEVSKTDQLVVSLTENEAREDLPIWRVGYRFEELLDLGFTQQELAARLGKTMSYISYACRIARGLHPDIARKLDRIPEVLNKHQVLALAKIQDENLDPDLKEQEKAFVRMVNRIKVGNATGKTKPRSNKPSNKVKFRIRWNLYKNAQVRVPEEYRIPIYAFVRWLEGQGRASEVDIYENPSP